MMLLAAEHSDAGTFHSLAAAWISMMRAVAPPLRTYSWEVRMPPLPPVEKSPQTRLRATLCPGVGYSVVTFDQSHSSSSATSWARPVSVPWPISDRAMRITTVSLGWITTQALISGEPSAARTAVGPPKGISRPSARPVPTAAVPITKARRLRVGIWFMAISSNVRGGVNRFTHLFEGAAAADIGDGVVDILVGRLWVVLEKRRHRHDHAALAIAALRDVVGNPGLLHLMQGAIGSQTFDGGDLLASGFADQPAAGAHRDPVDVDGAGPALGDAAAVFCACEAGVFPNRPEQRRIRLDIQVKRLSVNGEVGHLRSPNSYNPWIELLLSSIHRLNFGSMLDWILEQFKSRICACAGE